MEGFIDTLETQSWFATFTRLATKVSMMLLNEFYFYMVRPGLAYLRGKVDGKTFQVSANDIANCLGVPTDGVTTYFNNVIQETI